MAYDRYSYGTSELVKASIGTVSGLYSDNTCRKSIQTCTTKEPISVFFDNVNKSITSGGEWKSYCNAIYPAEATCNNIESRYSFPWWYDWCNNCDRWDGKTYTKTFNSPNTATNTKKWARATTCNTTPMPNTQDGTYCAAYRTDICSTYDTNETVTYTKNSTCGYSTPTTKADNLVPGTDVFKGSSLTTPYTYYTTFTSSSAPDGTNYSYSYNKIIYEKSPSASANNLFSLPSSIYSLSMGTEVWDGSNSNKFILDTICTVLYDGSIWCWGGNNYGQVGNGLTTRAIIPQLIIAPSGYTVPSGYTGGTLKVSY